MATTLDEIARFLDEESLRYHRREQDIITGFATEHYRDSEGSTGVQIVIAPSENGEYLEIFSPGAYNCAGSPHKATALQAVLMVSWRTKLVQFEYDDNDGEIRVKVEFPLEDAPLTKRQLVRCIRGIAQIIDKFHPVIAGALEHGRIEWPPELEVTQSLARALAGGGSPDDLLRRFAEFLSKEGGGSPAGDLDLDD